MPRHCRDDRRPGRRCGAGLRSWLASLLWLVTALSVLQWAAPSVDQALFQRLLSQGGGEAGLDSGDRASQAFIDGRAPLTLEDRRVWKAFARTCFSLLSPFLFT